MTCSSCHLLSAGYRHVRPLNTTECGPILCAVCALQERLTQQAAERQEKGKAYNANYKPQRSKDEAKERRKAILSSIGEVSRVYGKWAEGGGMGHVML